MFNVVKVRDKTSCGNCKKAILPKSYCYGKGWIRLCLKCGEEFSHTAIGGFEDIIKMIKENQNELKQNKEKWKAENILANL